MKMINILCLILARGGSKRIPGKNIKPLGGKPLIAWTIECAKACKHVMRVIVSTDDPAIASVATQYGAEVPFLRPAEISEDRSKEIDAFRHALQWLNVNECYRPDIIVKLFPTSPFRKPGSVDKAIDLLLADSMADSVRSVVKCKEHPYKTWSIIGNRMIPFVPDDGYCKVKDSHVLAYQQLPEVYVQNASIDVLRAENISIGSITGDDIIPLVMDEDESIDINTPNDFLLAEAKLLKSEIREI